MPDRNNGNNSALIYAFQEANQDLISEPATPAASILRSVREQEAQFEKLTRELEVERRSVANQLDRVRYGSDTASFKSISTTDDSFSWRRSAQNESHLADESSIDDTRPDSQLIDSCLRALRTQDNMDYSTSYTNGPEPHYGSTMYDSPSMNGTGSPRPSSRQNGGYSPAVGTPTKNPNYQTYDYDPQQGYHDDRYQPPSIDGSDQYRDHDAPRDRYNDKSYPRYDDGLDGQYDRAPSHHGSEHYAPSSPHGSDRYGAAPRGGYGAPASPQVDRYSDSYRDPQRDILDYDIPRSDMAAIDRRMQPDDDIDERGWDNRSDSYDSNAPYDDRHDPYNDRGPVDHAPPRDPQGSQETLEMKVTPKHLGRSYDTLTRKPSSASSHGSGRDPRWRAPDLQEVIEYLGHQNEAIVANAAAYLQHLTYGDDAMKNKTRGLGGIPALVELLGNPTKEIHRSACGALRNISFGKSNEENKVAIKNAGGIPGLIRLLRTSEDAETQELVTGTLWNLSSAEPLKKQIVDDGLTVLTNNVIIPESGWSPDKTPAEDEHGGIPWSMTFRNATGCLRNTSSAGFETRGKMRECHGLVDCLVYVLKCAVKPTNESNDMDNKAVENVLCIMRNLSFRIANEANHPDAITKPARSPAKDSPSKKKGAPPPQGESSGCFGNQKKKKAMAAGNGNTGTLNKGTMDPNGPLPERTEPARGSELLWQPDMVKPYLSLLSECSNPITLEAAAGTLQNISAGEWIWGSFVRSQVRKDKGLPVLVELLRMENDRVVAAVARALRNLSVDPRNKELIGKYAMRDLVLRLPGGPAGDNEQKQLSHDSLTAILNALHEVILRNAENSKSLRDSSGIDRLVSITKNRANYPPVVVKAAFQVLSTMWSFKDLRVLYKKDGWDEQHFSPGFWTVGKGGSTSATGSPARFNTLPASGTPREAPQQRSGSVPVNAASPQPYQSSTLPASSKPSSYSPGPPRSGEAPPPFDSHSYDRRNVGTPQRDAHSGYSRDYRADEPFSDTLDPNSYSGDRDSLSAYSEGTQQSREEIPMREMPYASVDRREPPSEMRDTRTGSEVRRGPPVGGVPMFGTQLPQPQVAKGDAVYAQVNKDRKSQRSQYTDDYDHSPAPPSISVADAPAGDSWV